MRGLHAVAPRPRIVGGAESTRYEYPFVASIQHCEIGYYCSHNCGGSLIADQYILTAAHCFGAYPKPSEYQIMTYGHSVKAVTWEPATQHECTDVVKVEHIGCHASYNKDTMEADICILRLQRKPKCFDALREKGMIPYLDFNGGASTPGAVATVAGWGAKFEGGETTDEQREVDIPLISNAQCNAAYGYILDDMLCAAVDGGGKDSCQGDSGGPLLLPLAANRTAPVSEQWVQVGVVSWGIGCARSWFPGVYVRTAPFADWIASVTAAPPPPSPPPPAPAPSAPMPWLPPPPTAPLPILALVALAAVAVAAFGVTACLVRRLRRSRPALRELPMEALAVATSSPDPSFKTRTATASPVMSSPDRSFRSTPSPTSRPGTPAPAPASGHDILARLARL